MKYQVAQDNILIAEVYEQLLLETPATEANIQRFIKKYFEQAVKEALHRARLAHEGHEGEMYYRPFDEEKTYKRIMDRYKEVAEELLLSWTPKVQQVLRASGGNPDVFGYPNIGAWRGARDAANTSNTDKKKAYKAASEQNVPLVLETNRYNVYLPKTWEASRRFFGVERISLLDGQMKNGSNWCTAASNSSHWEEYVNKRKDKLVYFISKPKDRLFAARIRTVGKGPLRFGPQVSTEALPPPKTYEAWLKGTVEIMKLIKRGFGSFKGAREGGRVKDYFSMRSLIEELENGTAIVECRDQTNNRLATLWELYIDLTQADRFDFETVTDYFEFLKFVVYGVKD